MNDLFYPPRAENLILANTLPSFEKAGFVAQPKLNGSNATLYFDGQNANRITNRHKEPFKVRPILEGLHELYYRPMVLNGEWMNKGNPQFKDKFVIFDLLGIDGVSLVGSTFEARLSLLDQIFGPAYTNVPTNPVRHLYGNIYRVNTYESDFKATYEELIKVDWMEGLVLKRLNGKLGPGTRESNNSGWQIKVRKPNNSYKA